MNLRLQRLELLGFKSFADKTVLEFDRTFTGIVGPNGCGKSNVVDAIRWVLGERRAKSMRGGEMADVVFKGSVSRPALSFAEVSMVLDNSAGEVEGVGPEFSITRRIATDGEGEYLINGERARLKDIRDLLFDTGLGSRGYSVLEQGRIDAVLSANPLERRAIFEEAAGISRYRQRKKEAESRLGRVEQDVARVDDVLRELTSRVRSLKLQASKAEKYVRVRDEWRTERTRFLRHKVHALNADLARVGAALAELESRAADLRVVRTSRDAEAQEREALQRELAQRVDELSAVVAQLAGEGRALDERHEQLSARIEGWRATVAEESQRVETLGAQLGERRRVLAELDRELESRRAALGVVEERASAAASALREAKAHYRAVRERSEAHNQLVLGLLHEKTAAQNKVAHLDASQPPLDARRERAAVRVGEARAAFEGVRAALGAARDEREQALAQLAETEQELRLARGALEVARAGRAALAEQRGALEVEIGRLQSHVEALRDQERERTSLESGARALLESLGDEHAPVRSDELLGLFADRVRVETRYARALDTALGARALALVARGGESVAPILAWLAASEAGEVELLVPDGLVPGGLAALGARERPETVEGADSAYEPGNGRRGAVEFDALGLFCSEGRVAEADSERSNPPPSASSDAAPAQPFSPRSEPAVPAHDDARIVGRLAELALAEPGFEALVEALIGDVWVATDLDAALALVAVWPRLRFATPTGALVAATGVLGGHREVAQGAIGRRSTAVDLEAEQRERELEFAELGRRDAELAHEVSWREQAVAGVEEQLERARQRASEAQAAERAQDARLADLEGTLEVVAAEEAQIALESEELLCERERARAELAETSERFQAENEQLGGLERERHEAERSRDQAAQVVSAIDVELARAQAEVRGHAERRVDLERAVHDNEAEVERAKRLAEEAGAHAERAAGDVEALARRSRQLADERAAREVELAEFRENDREGRSAISALRRGLEEVTVELEQTLQALTQRQLDEQRHSLSRDELLGRSLEELELSEGDLLSGFEPEPELAGVAVGGSIAGGSDPESDPESGSRIASGEAARALLDELDRKVAELRRELDRIGPVNTDALADLEETEQRLNFLEGQRRDLADARQTLLATLATINDESCKRFLETFEEVREAFSKLFRKLFGGGRADLELEQGVDPLEAGIEITARPPGREMLPIGLLSGGQRTMTALGLLFAVFQTRPSPFCVLDEVDAALDDANVGRFLAMLDDFRDSTQFIVVTHNKGTMSACDMLYGITMETKGVSSHVSVEFGEVERFVPEVTGDVGAASESRQQVREGAARMPDDDDEGVPRAPERQPEREHVMQPRRPADGARSGDGEPADSELSESIADS